jgi:hypothetical protein
MDHIEKLCDILSESKMVDFYCAIWKILHRLCAALRNIATVSLERSCSEHLRD